MPPDYKNLLPGIPTDKVLEMRYSGLSNNQIIQNLQREGYTQTQIFDAMNQAEIKGGVSNIAQDALRFSEPANPMNMAQVPLQSQQNQNFGANPNIMQKTGGQADFQIGGTVTTEELVEALIDEKWNELLKDISKIIDWKEKADSRIQKIEQEFSDMKNNFEQLHRAVVGKVGEYDKHILDVGSEIAAMEKVFQKILPTFTDNVNELSRVTEKLKKK